MKDLTIGLENRPGALATMGSALGNAGVSIAGGGAWVVNGQGTGHFLVDDVVAARRALQAAGIEVLSEREVVVQRLNQDQPGQLGKLTQNMAEAGVNIDALYSDHDHRLVLVVDDVEKARAVSEAWERQGRQSAGREAARPVRQHTYNMSVQWTGNDGEGTKTYRSYRRDHTIEAAGKPQIPACSDPCFRGDASRYNPEDLLVASLSACHMLAYLHLCAVNQVCVTDYRDEPIGVMNEYGDGAGEFVQVTLRPRVQVTPDSDGEKALALHHEAHCLCFIANSVKFAVEVAPEITTA
jgi:organic hydroperoxide reductase OsmC/OhrA